MGQFTGPSREREVRPLLHLRVAMIFSVPLGNFSGRGKPDFAMAFSVTDELTEQVSAERPAADEGMVTPNHELRIRLALFIETIETVLPHLQQVTRRSPGPLVARIIVQILKIGQYGDFFSFDLKRVRCLLVLRVHPISVAALHDHLWGIDARCES